MIEITDNYISILKPENVKRIDKIDYCKVYDKENSYDVVVTCFMNYRMTEDFIVCRLFKDYKIQGCYTYINGIEKEYKTVKPALNAIAKYYNLFLNYDEILINLGLKNPNKGIRKYKQHLKEIALKEENKKINTTNNDNDININNDNNEQLNKEDQEILNNKDMISLSDTVVNSLTNNTKLANYKEEIKEYCYNCYKKELLENEENKRKTIEPFSSEYIKSKLYRFAATLIDTMNWNYYEGDDYKGKYQGRQLHCKDCKYCNIDTRCNYTCTKIKEKYSNIDIQVYKNNDICSNFKDRIQINYNKEKYNSLKDYLGKTNKLKNISFTDWKKEQIENCNFKDYIHFLKNCIYIDYKGDTTIKYKSIEIYFKDKTLFIPIDNSYFNLDFIKDNAIYCNKITVKSKKRNKTSEVIALHKIFNLE